MQKNRNIDKIAFKVVQMKFLAMHITNQKLSFDIFTVGNSLNIFMEHDLNYNFDPYNVFLAIVTHIPQRLNTAFVLHGLISNIYLFFFQTKLYNAVNINHSQNIRMQDHLLNAFTSHHGLTLNMCV